MFEKRKERKLTDRMDTLIAIGQRRREGAPKGDHWRDWYEYLKEEEQKEYSRLAYAHELMVNRSDQFSTSTYFSPRRDFGVDDPNSPKGWLTVQYNASTKVEWVHFAEHYWLMRDGKRDTSVQPIPEAAFGWKPVDDIEEYKYPDPLVNITGKQ
jgi:hypothetical protein